VISNLTKSLKRRPLGSSCTPATRPPANGKPSTEAIGVIEIRSGESSAPSGTISL
jgi:hypothetical protein